ncbi:hypothetical protein WMY93_002978 [Mugilogobius chulae]|uniref:DUF4371 domain-containing protein n=1 Tax=Mugilogobius chulae TaxID=88201 RepID=A0AAW0Q564_9GOBI
MEGKTTCDGYNGQPGCIVEQLLENPFVKKVFSEKLIILDKGRPTPPLTKLVQEDSKVPPSSGGYRRHFQTVTYDKNPWLTGCPYLNRLFCWPCLLFCGEQVVWNTKGYSELGNLCESMISHEHSQNHIRSVIFMRTFGGSQVGMQMSPHVKSTIEKHNKKVKNNRDVLQRIINIVTALTGQEQILLEQCEENSEANHGSYVELVNLVKGYDVTLATHLETSGVFSDISSQMHNDLVEAVSTVMMDELQSEINNATFITIMLDENTDLSNRPTAQLSVVLRFVGKDRTVSERFVGFVNNVEEGTAASLCEQFFAFVNKFHFGAKLIGLTYNGGVVTAGELGGLQAKVTEKFPCAIFLHSCAHDLNLVLSQACGRNKHCNIFFSTLNGLASFFSTSTKRTRALDAIIQARFPSAPPPRWNHTSELVQTAQEHYSSLVELFTNMTNEPYKWDSSSVLAASGFLYNLKNDTFRFLLQVFADIFAHTDVFFNLLKSKPMDIAHCVAEKNKLTEQLQRKQLEYHDGYAAFATVTNSDETPTKKARRSVDNEEDFLLFAALPGKGPQLDPIASSICQGKTQGRQTQGYKHMHPDAQFGSIMVWLRGALMTGSISWNQLDPEP